jgi:hypothetical protein
MNGTFQNLCLVLDGVLTSKKNTRELKYLYSKILFIFTWKIVISRTYRLHPGGELKHLARHGTEDELATLGPCTHDTRARAHTHTHKH